MDDEGRCTVTEVFGPRATRAQLEALVFRGSALARDLADAYPQLESVRVRIGLVVELDAEREFIATLAFPSTATDDEIAQAVRADMRELLRSPLASGAEPAAEDPRVRLGRAVVDCLRTAGEPLTKSALADQLRRAREDVGAALGLLVSSGTVGETVLRVRGRDYPAFALTADPGRRTSAESSPEVTSAPVPKFGNGAEPGSWRAPRHPGDLEDR